MEYKDDVHKDKNEQDKEKMICFCTIFFYMTLYNHNKVLSSAPEFPHISKANENTIWRWSRGQNLLQGFSFYSTCSPEVNTISAFLLYVTK